MNLELVPVLIKLTLKWEKIIKFSLFTSFMLLATLRLYLLVLPVVLKCYPHLWPGCHRASGVHFGFPPPRASLYLAFHLSFSIRIIRR
jgi:hypothetical protein